MENNRVELYLSAYGNESGEDRGMIKLSLDVENGILRKEDFIPLAGKSNMIVERGKELITSVQYQDGAAIERYDRSGSLKKRVKTKYFYSYGQAVRNRLLLASYASGVDSSYDLINDRVVKNVVHRRAGYEGSGKSHYIHQMKDGRVISVENALQQIYVYQDEDLNLASVMDFPAAPEKNPRLLSFHPEKPAAYLNTEKTNELIMLNTDTMEVKKTIVLSDTANTFSGGNVTAEDGKYLAVSLRGKNAVSVWYLDEMGCFRSGFEFPCGRTPRALRAVGDYLLVSCTDDDCVEAYRIYKNYVRKTYSLKICQPITFSMR